MTQREPIDVVIDLVVARARALGLLQFAMLTLADVMIDHPNGPDRERARIAVQRIAEFLASDRGALSPMAATELPDPWAVHHQTEHRGG